LREKKGRDSVTRIFLGGASCGWAIAQVVVVGVGGTEPHVGTIPGAYLAATVRSQKGCPRTGALCSCGRNAPQKLDLTKHLPPLLSLVSPLVPPMGRV